MREGTRGSSSSYLLTGLIYFRCKQFSSSGAQWKGGRSNLWHPHTIYILGYVTEKAGFKPISVPVRKKGEYSHILEGKKFSQKVRKIQALMWSLVKHGLSGQAASQSSNSISLRSEPVSLRKAFCGTVSQCFSQGRI